MTIFDTAPYVDLLNVYVVKEDLAQEMHARMRQHIRRAKSFITSHWLLAIDSCRGCKEGPQPIYPPTTSRDTLIRPLTSKLYVSENWCIIQIWLVAETNFFLAECLGFGFRDDLQTTLYDHVTNRSLTTQWTLRSGDHQSCCRHCNVANTKLQKWWNDRNET